jgi:hypothetical protein
METAEGDPSRASAGDRHWRLTVSWPTVAYGSGGGRTSAVGISRSCVGKDGRRMMIQSFFEEKRQLGIESERGCGGGRGRGG